MTLWSSLLKEDLHLWWTLCRDILADICGQGSASHEACVVAREEGDTFRNLFRFSKPSDRNLRNDAFQNLLRHGGNHFRVDVTRRDTIDGYSPLRVFLCKRLREADHPSLGR